MGISDATVVAEASPWRVINSSIRRRTGSASAASTSSSSIDWATITRSSCRQLLRVRLDFGKLFFPASGILRRSGDLLIVRQIKIAKTTFNNAETRAVPFRNQVELDKRGIPSERFDIGRSRPAEGKEAHRFHLDDPEEERAPLLPPQIDQSTGSQVDRG